MRAVLSELDDTSFFKRIAKNDVKGFSLLLTGFWKCFGSTLHIISGTFGLVVGGSQAT